MIATWTVIGVYDEGESFAERIETECPYEAMQIVSRKYCVNEGGHDLQIIGVIQTASDLIPACDDERGSAAYACDLAGVTP